MTGVLIKRRKLDTDRDRHTGRMSREDQGLEGGIYKPRNTKACQQTARSKDQARKDSSTRGRAALLTF